MTQQTIQPPASDVMTLREIADYLLFERSTIRRLLANRAIPGFRLGADWRFRRSDIDKWIEDRTLVAPGPASTRISVVSHK
jgi:excisionase family DNA binding protein